MKSRLHGLEKNMFSIHGQCNPSVNPDHSLEHNSFLMFVQERIFRLSSF